VERVDYMINVLTTIKESIERKVRMREREEGRRKRGREENVASLG
jgi:hypothetical protein